MGNHPLVLGLHVKLGGGMGDNPIVYLAVWPGVKSVQSVLGESL